MNANADTLSFSVTPKETTSDDYDWIDIDTLDTRVGKARCLIVGDTLTVFSIMIFPEYQGQGYGTRTVEMLKAHFPVLLADRVRFTARHFWEKMGFEERPDGTWDYHRRNGDTIASHAITRSGTTG